MPSVSRRAVALVAILAVGVPLAVAQPPPETAYTVVIEDDQDYPVGFYDLREVALGEFVNESGGPALAFRITVTDWDSAQSPYSVISVFFEHEETTWRSTVDADGQPVESTGYENSTFEECSVVDGVAYCWFGFSQLNITQGDTIRGPYALSYAGGGAGGTQQGVGQDYAPGGYAADAAAGPRGDDYVIQNGSGPDAAPDSDNATEGNGTATPEPTDASATPAGGDSPGVGAFAGLAALAWAASAVRRRR